jgi:putative copper export protein
MVRWVEFVALLTVIGAFGFRSGVLPPLAVRSVATADAADRARRLGESAVFLYLAAAVMRAYQESVAVHGAERALASNELLPMLTTTLWGWAWCAGLIGALLVLAGWRLSRGGAHVGSALAFVGVAAMIMAPGLSGHAAVIPLAPLAVAVDALHVAATGVWMGGLFHVAFAGIPAMTRFPDEQRDGAVAALINSFHPVALFCAPLVVVTGLIASWLRLTHLDDLWTTVFGQNLMWKLIMFAFVAIMGAVNWLWMRPQLGQRAASRRLRVTLFAELFFATVVLLITAALVSSPVPAVMTGR